MYIFCGECSGEFWVRVDEGSKILQDTKWMNYDGARPPALDLCCVAGPHNLEADLCGGHQRGHNWALVCQHRAVQVHWPDGHRGHCSHGRLLRLWAAQQSECSCPLSIAFSMVACFGFGLLSKVGAAVLSPLLHRLSLMTLPGASLPATGIPCLSNVATGSLERFGLMFLMAVLLSGTSRFISASGPCHPVNGCLCFQWLDC